MCLCHEKLRETRGVEHALEQEQTVAHGHPLHGRTSRQHRQGHRDSRFLIELDALWGRAGGALLRERLLEAETPAEKLRELEAALLAQAVRPLTPDHASAFAVAALDRGVAVAAVADRLGLTPKRLARRFADEVGLTPKRFARVRRFQRVLLAAGDAARDAAGVDWARLAADCGYYDQAHLIHDFRAFSGMSPSAYRPRSAWEHNHVQLVT